MFEAQQKGFSENARTWFLSPTAAAARLTQAIAKNWSDLNQEELKQRLSDALVS